jgi:SAM-dependent methyltransferase
MPQLSVSPLDVEHLKVIRENVVDFMRRVAKDYSNQSGDQPGKLLDIAPQDHQGASPFFPKTVQVETLDINPASGCTYIGDICRHNDCLPNDSYQYVVCTEVLEHTLQPFHAIQEIQRILMPGGFLFLTCPFNFRIHGPLPDCWRFTEHGLRALLQEFTILELEAVETPDRPLMPIHYTVVAQKALDRSIPDL